MNAGALSDIRVVEYGNGVSAPFCAKQLASLGAEVIKIESNHRIDACRMIPPFPDGKGGGVNRGGQFNTYNRNKKSCTLNLSRPRAKEIAKQLVSLSDVVVENFSPPVMARLGLDYDVCRVIKPDIVYLSLSGYGATGPSRDFVSYGMQLQAFSGMGSLTGYADGPPRNLGTAVADTVGGLTGAFGILAALHHRRRTGEGQNIDVSQCEALAAFCPEAVLNYIMNGKIQGRVGNRDELMAPHNVYRCKGENNWVSIAISTDEQWRGPCDTIGRTDLIDDPRFVDGISRHRNQEELDRIISTWAIGNSDYDAMHRLQASGVPATVVFSNAQLVNDPHLKERGFCVEDRHPETGKRVIPGVPWHLNRTPGSVRTHAPLLGEHNDEILGGLLHMSEDEINDLMDKEVVY